MLSSVVKIWKPPFRHLTFVMNKDTVRINRIYCYKYKKDPAVKSEETKQDFVKALLANKLFLRFQLVAGIFILKQLNFKKMEDIILNSYKRERDSELATTSIHIVEGMENNPYFPDPPAELAAVKKLLPGYQTAVANAKGRDKVMVSFKKDKKAEMVALLTKLAAYVTLTCKGDRTMLLSSGFPISGDQGEQPMPVIQKLDVKLGPPGMITTRVKRVAGARAYMHQYTTEPPTSETVWISEGSLQASYTFSGLKSAVKYWIRVVALGGAGQTVYSPVESCIIQ
jgi:hypothetical protein